MSVRGDELGIYALKQWPNTPRGLEVEQTGASSQFYDKFSWSTVDDPASHLLTGPRRCSTKHCVHLQGYLEQPCSPGGPG